MKPFLIAFIASASLLLPSIDGECGYKGCHTTDPKKLNIHLIPHSHDDVGWMITLDSYYEGYVRKLITNTVRCLEANAERRFTQVEMAYFYRWWNEQSSETRDVVKKLVKSGQLVFTNGGWTTNDEGAANYNNIIDQMTLGLKFLNDTFGRCAHPKVSWQIDPFGASREMASLYAQMGFDGHVVNRGPNTVGAQGEWLWNGSPNDLNNQIFTTDLHQHYSAPVGFDFEDGSNAITDKNKKAKAEAFVAVAKQWNVNYGNTNQVLMPMGDDFRYVNADNWFKSMDALIAEVTARHRDVNVFYSSPNCYIKAVNEMNVTFNERYGDYMLYWVGYYANRPALKYEDRVTNNMLQAARQLDVLARLDSRKSGPFLAEARNELAVLTHHDAITGTSPQATVNDYYLRLQSGFGASKAVIKSAYSYLKNSKRQTYGDDVSEEDVFCDALNITECGFTETHDKIAVTVYNPIARPVSQYVSLPVVEGEYVVYDSEGANVTQMASFSVSDGVRHLPERHSNATNELIFKAHLPALGFTTYLVERKSKTNDGQFENAKPTQAVDDMKGKSFSLQIDENTGALKTITVNGKAHKLQQTFKYYESLGGKQGFEDSGSYHFCPNGAAHDFEAQKLVSRHTSVGGIHELSQQFSDYIQQTVRTYEDEDYIELDWTVGPIPTGDGVGKEIITRFETDLKTDGLFYTDANGRQTMKRKFDNSSKGCTDNVISGNWYPINSRAFIRDEKEDIQLSVVTDRSQGGSSLTEGELELMVHRRLTQKGFGGDFLINETDVDGQGLRVRGKHYVFFQPIAPSAQMQRNISERLSLAPIVSFQSYSTREEYTSKRVVSYSSVSHSLPESVHLLTLENWRPNEVLLRLEHMYESADSHEVSQPVDIDLQDLFKGLKILDFVETNLVANELLSESEGQRMKWLSKKSVDSVVEASGGASNMTVRLTPQQIRTFILTVDDNEHKEDNCTVNWVECNQNSIPSDAYEAGYDEDKNPLFICRHTMKEELIAGRANKHLGCVFTFNGSEFSVKNEDKFEVLVAKNVHWVPHYGGDAVPQEALAAGHNHDGGNTYVGRCLTHEEEVVGKVDYKFSYGFKGKEYTDCDSHDILICV